MPAPPRTMGNYRAYGDVHVDRLVFIRHCLALGIPLDGIRQLLAVKDEPQHSCGGENRLIEERLAQVRERIRALQALECAPQQIAE